MSDDFFKKTGDADYPRHMKVLVTGPPKSGKTTFLATAPNVVVAACEAGLMSIAHKNIGYVEIDSIDKLATLHGILKDPTLRQRAAASMGLPAIETVCIDTADALQEIAKKEVLRQGRRTEMQQADWGKLKETMSAQLKAFIALPLNVIITVHVDVTQDEEQRQIYAPALQGAIKNEIAGWVDFSLLSFRQKETAPDGTASIKYYLKNEGDAKNPHVGNRGGGRVPEICVPDFMTLHGYVYDGLDLPKTERVAMEMPEPAPVSEAAPAPAAEPAGVRDDSDDPINPAGKQAITKMYKSHKLVPPPDLDTWTLGKARQIAKFNTAVKADIAMNRGTIDELYSFLKEMDAWHGPADDAEVKPTVAKKASVAPAPTVEAPKAVEPEASPEVTEEQALETVTAQLGGVVLGQKITADATCEVCGNQVDDLDIANLSNSRFRKVMCVADYKNANREKETASA